ncbi:hypothetical protein A8C56_23140 [Niabella ginsenosidivorans]|uniref:Uncharacterized protein n=1 Tax=Niabella ginsenosidivorans TaxID=1176587 RepID=A0A1A9I818_9BACT|nr:hypothetical protein [Niabella ginsenosidivorans]ANH83485.1 hypothetical protein A8C56_23140 [Niabella ginsenosidivorans]
MITGSGGPKLDILIVFKNRIFCQPLYSLYTTSSFAVQSEKSFFIVSKEVLQATVLRLSRSVPFYGYNPLSNREQVLKAVACITHLSGSNLKFYTFDKKPGRIFLTCTSSF